MKKSIIIATLTTVTAAVLLLCGCSIFRAVNDKAHDITGAAITVPESVITNAAGHISPSVLSVVK